MLQVDHSSDTYYDVEAAIRTGHLGYARERLRDLLPNNPDAHAWYLAALVAPTPEQRRQRLEKALRLDPDHHHARQELAQLLTGTPASTPNRPLLARLRHRFD
jgi:ferric-dicitrate binding protein FerR (iron transport regulator)